MAFEHYDKCSLLLPMDGANNGTTFTDWGPNPKTVTVAGNAKTVTAQSKYYGSSGYFDGSGDALTVGSSAETNLAAGDFTICFYMYASDYGQDWYRILQFGPPDTNGCLNIMAYGGSPTRRLWVIGQDAGVFVEYCASSAETSIVLNQWQHVAVTRSGDTFRLFINGVYKTGSTKATTLVQNPIYIGNSPTMSTSFNGYLQDLLIIKGAALWTSDFTPPARLIGQLTGNVKDYAGTNAQRTIVAMPRTTPTRAFTTTSDPSTGNYTLGAPSVESSAILLANEPTLYNDLVHRVTPE